MIKKLTAAVRLKSANPDSRPTIKTPNGEIYAGTPEADHWLFLKNYADPLQTLSESFKNMTFERAQAVEEIQALLPLVRHDSGITETLMDLSEALQGRLSNYSGSNCSSPGSAFPVHVTRLQEHSDRVQFGLGCTASAAPKPLHPDARPRDPGQPLGTGLRTLLG